MWRRVSYVLVGLSMTACAAAAPPTSRRSFQGAAGREVITASEIVSSRVTDAYQAVAHLRPEFLRHRSVRLASYAPAPVAVYLDELPFGNAETLRYIPLGQVRLIRYLSPSDADLRWGGMHPAGAILVTTLKQLKQ